MKKFKTLLLSTTPLLATIVLQTLASFYLVLLAAIYLFVIAPYLQDKFYTMEDLLSLAENMTFNSLVQILFSITCIILFGIWYKKRCNGTFQVSIRKDFHLFEFLGIACLVPATQFVSSFVMSITSVIFPKWLDDYMELIEKAGLSGDVSILMMIYAVCLAPISEELIFRGVTMGIARKAFPFWIANIIQALLFGIFHINPLQACYTFVVGLFMGYIYHKGGTIYHTIFFHFLFNLWGTTVSKLLTTENPVLQGLIILLGSIVGTVAGLILLNKGSKMKQ